MRKIFLLISLISLIQGGVFGQKKNKYSLFNPVPKDKMRDLSTDRPDITESSQSVDAGHFQIETDLFKTTRGKSDGITSVENNYNLANLKLGLTQNIDIQLVVGSYVNTYEKDINDNKTYNSSSFGDLTLRLKYNLWGNDSGKTGFAMMPYVNFPTSKDNQDMEAGIVFPFSVALGSDFSFGTQAQFDLLKSQSSSGYHAGILQSFVLGKELTKSLEAFAESYYNFDFENKQFKVSVNGGLGYLLTPNLKVDAGFNLNVTKNTDKVYFIGFSFRY